MVIEIISETAVTNEIRAEVAANLTNIFDKGSIEINGIVVPIVGSPVVTDSAGNQSKWRLSNI